jgi:hypothetical protein
VLGIELDEHYDSDDSDAERRRVQKSMGDIGNASVPKDLQVET